MLSARVQGELMGSNVGTTIRQASTALLTIDSEDRFPSYAAKRLAIPGSYNYSPYDFIITKNESIMNGFFTRLGLSEVVFPWTIPNINFQTDRILITYQPPAGLPITTTVQIGAGFYKPSELATAITNALIVIDPLFTGTVITYGDSLSFDFNFTATTLLSVEFRTMPYQPNVLLPNYYEFQNTKQLYDVLGFMSVPFGSRFNGDSTLCQSTRYVDIVCQILTYNQALKDTTTQLIARDSLARLYLGALNSNMNVPPSDPTFAPPGTTPGVIYAMYNNPKQINWTPNQPVPSGLRFEVFDDEGMPLDMLFQSSPEINWSASILISEN
jgi:hypothetical protein